MNGIFFIGKIKNGSSCNLAGAPEHEYLSVGSNWYTAFTQEESEYSFKLSNNI